MTTKLTAREAPASYLVNLEVQRVRPGYKQTEVGEIPEDWDVVPIGLLGSFAKGQGIRKDEAASGEIPCVRYGEIYTHHNDHVQAFNSFISADVAKSSKRLKKGDLLFAGSGETKEEIGKCVAFLDDVEAYAGGDIVILSPVKGDSSFFGYLFNAPVIARQKASKGQGDAVVHISATALSSVKIPLPPTKTEQEAIAGALSDVDALIEALEQLIAKKRRLKQGTMQELLTGRKRLPGFGGEWKEKRLGEVAIFYKGRDLPKSALEADGKEPCIHYGELFTRYSETIREIISYTNTSDGTFRSVANDVLMPTSDVTPRGLAKASCVRINGVILGGDILVIRSDTKLILGSFLSYLIRYEEKQVLQLVTGSTVFHLYGTDMKKFTFFMPPLPEQTAIAAILSDMDAEIAALERQLAKARGIKQGVMQELLTGRIRLV